MENQDSKRAELLEQAKLLTRGPGVYLMKNSEGEVLYVGKAKDLKNRVSSYFKPQPHENSRIELLVRVLVYFDVILTETESEALLLECTLIKKYKPKFNVRLKDSKAYPYLKITLHSPYPRLQWTRVLKKDGSQYFGPFSSSQSAQQTVAVFNQWLQLRDCSDNSFLHRSRPCLLYQIESCSAPCVGYIHETEYKEKIQKVVSVLSGQSDELQKMILQKIKEAADDENFELAAVLRDELKNIHTLVELQGVVDVRNHKNFDVLGFVNQEGRVHAAVLNIVAGRMNGVVHREIENAEALSQDEILIAFCSQLYLMGERKKLENLKSKTEEILELQEIIAEYDDSVMEQVDLISEAISIKIRRPQTPEEIRLLQVAKTNALNAAKNSKNKSIQVSIDVLEELQRRFFLKRFPFRIECFDISNTQGDEPVASRSVFIQGKPDSSLYRKYKIHLKDGPNDFAMMKEVIMRRFQNDSSRPDLIVIDGGKGQLAQALAVFEELGIHDVDCISLAKSKTQSSFRSQEIIQSEERVFLPGRSNAISLKQGTGIFQVLTQIRDEAHRFALQFHRQRRSLKAGF